MRRVLGGGPERKRWVVLFPLVGLGAGRLAGLMGPLWPLRGGGVKRFLRDALGPCPGVRARSPARSAFQFERWAWPLLFAALLPAAVGLLRVSAGHPYFAVSEISVSGAERVTPGTVLALSGIRRGQSVWSVSPSEVARRLGTHPWIKHARVTRQLPRSVIIRVKEWKARAIVRLGNLYYVDHNGRVFARVSAGPECDLPFITGLWPLLKQGHSGFARSSMREALAFLDQVESAGLDLRVSELHIDRQAGIEMFVDDPALAVEFGWGEWATKVGYLRAVLARWQGQGDRLARVDLTYRGQAVVRLRGGRG